MTVKEQHFQCGWSDKNIINVSRYKKYKGLDLNYFFEIRRTGQVPTKKDVESARLEAFRVEDNCDRVIITYLDSENVPENSRNAPLDGNKENNPKKRVDLNGDQFYEWKPLTHQDEMTYRKKVYDSKKKNKR